MSASSTPTVKPRAASAVARLTVHELLPTPPLPLAIASTWQVVGHGVGGGVLAGVPARLAHHVGALLGVHLAPVDAHVGHARVEADALLDLLLDVGPQRAAADRELDADRDDAVVADGDAGHHAERHDVGAQLGVDHGAQHVLDLGLQSAGRDGHRTCPQATGVSVAAEVRAAGRVRHCDATGYHGRTTRDRTQVLGSMTTLVRKGRIDDHAHRHRCQQGQGTARGRGRRPNSRCASRSVPVVAAVSRTRCSSTATSPPTTRQATYLERRQGRGRPGVVATARGRDARLQGRAQPVGVRDHQPQRHAAPAAAGRASPDDLASPSRSTVVTGGFHSDDEPAMKLRRAFVRCDRRRPCRAPIGYRRRILAVGLIAAGALYSFGAPLFVNRIEDDLEQRVPEELAEAGFTGVAAEFDGQDGTLRCDAAARRPGTGDGARPTTCGACARSRSTARVASTARRRQATVTRAARRVVGRDSPSGVQAVAAPATNDGDRLPDDR